MSLQEPLLLPGNGEDVKKSLLSKSISASKLFKQESVKIYGDDECSYCLAAVATVTFEPCMHRPLCQQCWEVQDQRHQILLSRGQEESMLCNTCLMPVERGTTKHALVQSVSPTPLKDIVSSYEQEEHLKLADPGASRTKDGKDRVIVVYTNNKRVDFTGREDKKVQEYKRKPDLLIIKEFKQLQEQLKNGDISPADAQQKLDNDYTPAEQQLAFPVILQDLDAFLVFNTLKDLQYRTKAEDFKTIVRDIAEKEDWNYVIGRAIFGSAASGLDLISSQVATIAQTVTKWDIMSSVVVCALLVGYDLSRVLRGELTWRQFGWRTGEHVVGSAAGVGGAYLGGVGGAAFGALIGGPFAPITSVAFAILGTLIGAITTNFAARSLVRELAKVNEVEFDFDNEDQAAIDIAAQVLDMDITTLSEKQAKEKFKMLILFAHPDKKQREGKEAVEAAHEKAAEMLVAWNIARDYYKRKKDARNNKKDDDDGVENKAVQDDHAEDDSAPEACLSFWAALKKDAQGLWRYVRVWINHEMVDMEEADDVEIKKITFYI